MATVLDHVLDTVQHLLKKKVALERAIDPDTPDIIADGSRIVQVGVHPYYCAQESCFVPNRCLCHMHDMPALLKLPTLRDCNLFECQALSADHE